MSNIEDNTNCMECGNAFELHSMDRRCPKNGGFQINGKLEFFATHFEPEISETDQLRAELSRLTAGNEAMQEDARNNTATINRLKELNDKQAAEITALKKACIVYLDQIINMQADDE